MLKKENDIIFVYIKNEKKRNFVSENFSNGYRKYSTISVYVKKWAGKNKDKIRSNCKKYYLNNKEKLAAYHKDYYDKNKEKISAYYKEYNKKNKEI